ncbi:MAG: hypothetical protein WCJ56_01720, partial [bacterium]
TFPGTPLRFISALTGAGVAEWLGEIKVSSICGEHIVEVDYDIYAEGEAVLGWLNASASVTTSADVDWRAFADGIITGIRQEAQAVHGSVAHVKLSLTAQHKQLHANLTSTDGVVNVIGDIPADVRQLALTVNARVEMTPDTLQQIVERVLQAAAVDGISVDVATICSLSPGRPTPTYRYGAVV